MAYARRLIDQGAGVRRSSELPPPDADPSLFAEYHKQVAKKARGQLAPRKIVDCVEAAVSKPFPDGMQVEREAFLECMASPQSRGMRHMFFAEREAAKVRGLAKDTPLRDDIRLLGRLLGDMVREQEGQAIFDTVEQIRRTSIRFHRDR